MPRGLYVKKRKEGAVIRILAIDPGKASGISLFEYEVGQEPKMISTGEYQMREYAQPIRLAIASALDDKVQILIVCERFIINAQTAKNTQAPYSLEMIGVAKQIMLDYGIDPETLIFQSPSDAKAMFPNPALKKLDYWFVGGEGHSLDSIRHALLRTVKLGWKPMRLLQ